MFSIQQRKLFLFFYVVLFTTHIFKCDTPAYDSNIQESAASVAASSKDLFYSLGSLFRSIGHECRTEVKKWQDSVISYIADMKMSTSPFSINIYPKQNNLEITINGFAESEMQNCCDAEIEYDRHQFPVAVAINGNNQNPIIQIIHKIDSAFVNVKVIRKAEQNEKIMVDGKETDNVKIIYGESHVVSSIDQQLDLENLTIEFDTVTKTVKIEIPYKEKQKRSVSVKIK